MCHESCPHPISGGRHLQDQNLTIQLDNGESLPLFLVLPEKTPAPAVLIVHDVFGAGAFYQDLSLRLAEAGFIAALPDLYFRHGPLPEHTIDAARERSASVPQYEAFSDMRSVLTWLRDHGSSTGKIGIVGMCWGGSMAMLASSRSPRPDACVAFYGFPVRERTENAPVVAMDEEEIGKVSSPVLGLWGDQDRAVGMDNVAAYDNALTARQKLHEFIVYPGIGHGFLTFDPNAEAYEHSRDAWTRTLAFLNEHLGGPAAG